MELTREQFVKEINGLKEGTTVNVSSSDIGNVTVYLRGRILSADLENGVEGELTILKVGADMEVTYDFDIVEGITKEDNTYTLSFGNGLSDVDIEIIA